MGGHSRQQDPGKDRGREKSRVVECGEQDTGAGGDTVLDSEESWMPLLGLWTRPHTQLSRSHALGSHRLILHGKGGCWGPAGPAPVTPVTPSWMP